MLEQFIGDGINFLESWLYASANKGDEIAHSIINCCLSARQALPLSLSLSLG